MRVRRPWIWWAWLAAVVISGGVLEGLAVSDDEGLSFSQFFVNIKYAWPPISAVAGIAIGILICHFSWHWVPKQKRATCAECGETILLPLKKEL